MVEIIAHRARLDDGKFQRDNTIESIYRCLDAGFSVEVDVKYGYYPTLEHEIGLGLGHDYIVEKWSNFLIEDFYYDALYLHAKDFKTIEHLVKQNDYMWFVQDKDPYAPIINSGGLIWMNLSQFEKGLSSFDYSSTILTLNDKLITSREILHKLNKFYGICTDYPVLYKTLLEEYI